MRRISTTKSYSESARSFRSTIRFWIIRIFRRNFITHFPLLIISTSRIIN